MIPRAYVGAAAGGGIYLLDEGYRDEVDEDVYEDIVLRAETNAIAPGGASADHSFDWLRVTLTHTMAAILTVTPIVDGIPLTEAAFIIGLESRATRKSVVHECLIRMPDPLPPAAEKRRYAPTGTWLSVRIDVAALDEGDLILDGVEVEYDVLTPTKVRPA